jgi:hypothetical protein
MLKCVYGSVSSALVRQLCMNKGKNCYAGSENRSPHNSKQVSTYI